MIFKFKLLDGYVSSKTNSMFSTVLLFFIYMNYADFANSKTLRRLETPLTVASAKVIVIQAIDDMIGYYENNYKTMNLDGIYGLRLLEGKHFINHITATATATGTLTLTLPLPALAWLWPAMPMAMLGTSAKNSKLSHSSKTKPIAQIQVGAMQCFLHECSSIISFWDIQFSVSVFATEKFPPFP